MPAKKPEESPYPENEKAMARQLKEAQELHPPYPPLSQEIVDSNNEAMARQAESVPTPTQAEMDAVRDYQQPEPPPPDEIGGPVDPAPVDPPVEGQRKSKPTPPPPLSGPNVT